MTDELYINGNKVDLAGGKSGIYLTYKSNIFGDITKIKGNNSQTITLPLTQRNRDIIQCSFLPSNGTTFPYSAHSADVYRDGIPLVTGATCLLTKTTPQSAEIVLTWGVSDKIQTFVGTSDELPVLADTYTYAWTWWNNTVNHGDMRDFPVAKYGFNDNETAAGYHPVVSVATLMQQISNRYGVTFGYSKTPWLDNDWVLPLLQRLGTTESAEFQKPEGSTINQYLFKYYTSWHIVTKYDSSVYGDVMTMWQDEAYPEIGQFNVQAKNTKVRVSGHVYIRFVLTNMARIYWQDYLKSMRISVNAATYRTIQTPTNWANSTLLLTINQTGYGRGDIAEGELFPTEGWVSFDFDEETDYIEQGDNIYFHLISSYPGQGIEAVIVSANSPQVNITVSATQEQIEIGDSYHLAINFPKIKVVDFIKSLMQMCCMFAFVDNEGKIQFMDYGTLDANKVNAVDWSDCLLGYTSIPETMEFTAGVGYRNNQMLYGGDADDSMNGEFSLDNDALEYSGELVKSSFKSYKDSKGIAYFPIYSYDNEGNLEYDSDDNPYLCKRTTEVSYDDNDTPTYTYTLTRQGIKWNDLISSYYGDYIEAINHAKVITERFVLKPVVLKDVDMRIPVYLRQYGAYFAISEIKTKENNISEVKLVKI